MYVHRCTWQKLKFPSVQKFMKVQFVYCLEIRMITIQGEHFCPLCLFIMQSWDENELHILIQLWSSISNDLNCWSLCVLLGEKGFAYTLVTEKDKDFAGHLVRNLETAGQHVPHALLELAEKVDYFYSWRIQTFLNVYILIWQRIVYIIHESYWHACRFLYFLENLTDNVLRRFFR